MEPTLVVRQFDVYLSERGVHFRGVVIGGSALALLGVIARQTKDCDVLDPALPAPVQLAARDFASERRKAGDPLADDWLNNGPASLTALLPAGWRDRSSPHSGDRP